MTQQEHHMLRETLDELKRHLMEQGCHTLRDGITRDYVTFVRLVQVMEHLGYIFSEDVYLLAGVSQSTQGVCV